MGYQNNDRPERLEDLLTDAGCDLTDLCEEIRLLSLDDREYDRLTHAVKFIEETLKLAKHRVIEMKIRLQS